MLQYCHDTPHWEWPLLTVTSIGFPQDWGPCQCAVFVTWNNRMHVWFLLFAGLICFSCYFASLCFSHSSYSVCIQSIYLCNARDCVTCGPLNMYISQTFTVKEGTLIYTVILYLIPPPVKWKFTSHFSYIFTKQKSGILHFMLKDKSKAYCLMCFPSSLQIV